MPIAMTATGMPMNVEIQFNERGTGTNAESFLTQQQGPNTLSMETSLQRSEVIKIGSAKGIDAK